MNDFYYDNDIVDYIKYSDGDLKNKLENGKFFW